jgi:hypothetical protein
VHLVIEVLESEHKSVTWNMTLLRAAFVKQNGADHCLARHFRLSHTVRLLDSIAALQPIVQSLPRAPLSSSILASSPPTPSPSPLSAHRPSMSSSAPSVEPVRLFGVGEVAKGASGRGEFCVAAEVTIPALNADVRGTPLSFDRTVTHGAQALDLCVCEAYVHLRAASRFLQSSDDSVDASSRATAGRVVRDSAVDLRHSSEMPHDTHDSKHPRSVSSTGSPASPESQRHQLSAFLTQLVTRRTALGAALLGAHQDALRSKEATLERLEALPSDSCPDFLATYKATTAAFAMLSSIFPRPSTS